MALGRMRGLSVLAVPVVDVFVEAVVLVAVLVPETRLARGRPRGLVVLAAGSVVALPDARRVARAARVSAMAQRSMKVEDAPQPPTWRANCRRMTPTKQG